MRYPTQHRRRLGTVSRDRRSVTGLLEDAISNRKTLELGSSSLDKALFPRERLETRSQALWSSFLLQNFSLSSRDHPSRDLWPRGKSLSTEVRVSPLSLAVNADSTDSLPSLFAPIFKLFQCGYSAYFGGVRIPIV